MRRRMEDSHGLINVTHVADWTKEDYRIALEHRAQRCVCPRCLNDLSNLNFHWNNVLLMTVGPSAEEEVNSLRTLLIAQNSWKRRHPDRLAPTSGDR